MEVQRIPRLLPGQSHARGIRHARRRRLADDRGARGRRPNQLLHSALGWVHLLGHDDARRERRRHVRIQDPRQQRRQQQQAPGKARDPRGADCARQRRLDAGTADYPRRLQRLRDGIDRRLRSGALVPLPDPARNPRERRPDGPAGELRRHALHRHRAGVQHDHLAGRPAAPERGVRRGRVRPVGLPALGLPPVRVPAVGLLAFGLPALGQPVGVPALGLQPVCLPPLGLPAVGVPALGLPPRELQPVRVPRRSSL